MARTYASYSLSFTHYLPLAEAMMDRVRKDADNAVISAIEQNNRRD